MSLTDKKEKVRQRTENLVTKHRDYYAEWRRQHMEAMRWYATLPPDERRKPQTYGGFYWPGEEW